MTKTLILFIFTINAYAKYEVNNFIESKEAENLGQLKSSIMKVMNHYENAKKFWELYDSVNFTNSDFTTLNSSFTSGFFNVYPEANKEESQGGIISNLYNKQIIFPGTAISYVFSVASKELAISSALLKE